MLKILVSQYIEERIFCNRISNNFCCLQLKWRDKQVFIVIVNELHSWAVTVEDVVRSIQDTEMYERSSLAEFLYKK